MTDTPGIVRRCMHSCPRARGCLSPPVKPAAVRFAPQPGTIHTPGSMQDPPELRSREPGDAAFWLASTLLPDPSAQQALLEVDSAVERLAVRASVRLVL